MLSRKHLGIAGWIVLPMVTFGLGWALKPSTSAGRDVDSEGALRAKGEGASAISSRGGSGGERTGARGTGRGSGRSGVGSAQQSLSAAEITTLGERFRETGDPIAQRRIFLQMLDGMTVENAMQIREQIAHLSDESSVFRDFHYAWGKVGGAKAVLNGTKTDKIDMSVTLSGWASASPEEALAWFNGLPKTREKGSSLSVNQYELVKGLVNGLADANTQDATNFVVGLMADGNDRAGHMLHLLAGKVLQSRGPAEAATWAEGLPEGESRNYTMGRVAREYAQNDPEAAANWVMQYSDRPEAGHMAGQVGGQWARRDPQAAIAWLDELPASGGKNHGLTSAFSSWAGRSPEEAGNHIRQMAPSLERDSAISGYASRVAWENPTAALEWANSVNDPKVRFQTQVNTGRAYMRRDPKGAREWLESTGNEELRNTILNRSRRDR